MYNAIDRNSGLFDPTTSDQINNSFSKTLEKIENFSPEPLEPKYDISMISASAIGINIQTNNSFTIDKNQYILNMIIYSNADISDYDILVLGGVNVPFYVFGRLAEEGTANGCNYYIYGSTVHIKGTMLAGKKYLLANEWIQ